MKKKEAFLQLLEYLRNAGEYLQKTMDAVSELLGESIAADDVSRFNRSKFTLIVNREFSQNGRQALPDGEEQRPQKEEKPAEEREEKGTFKITNEEIMKMSKTIKGRFFTQGFSVCWRRRQSGKNTYTYQVRFQRDGYYIQFHEKNKADLKPRFLLELKKANQRRQEELDDVPVLFTRFATYYFEKFRKIKVSAKTYQSDLGRFKNHIKPYFENRKLSGITPSHCQNLLDSIVEQGKGKTADEVCSLLNGIFNCAVKHHIIQFSPMDMVIHVQHERKHGTSLTKEEEHCLLTSYKGSIYELPFAVALYTGLRPNEYASAKIEGDFIIAVNSKRKNRKVVYKKIPIMPMLRPYLVGVEVLKFPVPETMREKIKLILPNHILYDLRTTFYTRCKECGIAEAAREEYVGHSLGALGNAYTDLSDEFLLREGEKFKY